MVFKSPLYYLLITLASTLSITACFILSPSSETFHAEIGDSSSSSVHPDKSELEIYRTCPPRRVETTASLFISHFQCTSDDILEEAEPLQLSETFTATKGFIARKARYWARIFAILPKNAYAIHPEVYPEVMLEFAELKNPAQKDVISQAKLRKLLTPRLKKYENTLRQMHKLPVKKYSAEQIRIATLMAHIKDPDKFLQAARSLRLQKGQKENIALGLESSGKYLPHIKKIFRSQGVPEELAYIAFIESSFNLKAVSKVGASGVYQIMPRTGREFIRVTNTIDERRDPIKSAFAAANVFKRAYKITGHWPFAITGYNHGPYGIKKAMQRLGTSDIEVLIKKNQSRTFGYASKNFYVEFLAILMIMNHWQDYFPEISREQPLAYVDHRLENSRNIKDLSREFLVTSSEIAQLNPDLSKKVIWRNHRLPRGYVIKIPEKKYLASVKESGTK